MKWLGHVSRKAMRLMQPLVPRESGGVTILAYHLVGGGTQSPVDVPLDAFRAQLAELRDCAHVCSLADAITHLNAGTNGKKPMVVITFDDGFDNFRTTAWPALRELDLPCTLYVPVGFVEGTVGAPLRGAEMLAAIEWKALRALASDPQLTIGSHSWGHQDLRRMGLQELRDDLRRSQDRLQDRLQRPIVDFCYPQAKWSRPVEEEVQALYCTAAIAGGRRNTGDRFNVLRLGRIPVRRDIPVTMVPLVESTVWLEEWAASHARLIA